MKSYKHNEKAFEKLIAHYKKVSYEDVRYAWLKWQMYETVDNNFYSIRVFEEIRGGKCMLCEAVDNCCGCIYDICYKSTCSWIRIDGVFDAKGRKSSYYRNMIKAKTLRYFYKNFKLHIKFVEDTLTLYREKFKDNRLHKNPMSVI